MKFVMTRIGTGGASLGETTRSAFPLIGRRWRDAFRACTAVLTVMAAAAAPTLSLQKTISGGLTSVNTGTAFTYLLDWANPSTTENATNAVITDVLPAALSWASANVSFTTDSTYIQSASYNAASGTMTWTFKNPLPAGTSGQLTLTAQFPGGSTANGVSATNTAVISQTGGPSTTSAQAIISAVATFKHTAAKTTSTLGSPDSFTTYALKVNSQSAAGALDLNTVTIVDQLPAGSDGSFPSTGNVVQTGGSYNASTGQITWTTSAIAAGSSWSQTIFVLYPSSQYPVGTNVINTMTVTGTSPASVPESLTSSVTNRLVAAAPSIKQSKSASNSSPTNGASVSFTLTEQNNGNVTLTNARVVDAVPSGFWPTKVSAAILTGYSTVVSYQTNGNSTWYILGTNSSAQSNITPPTLPSGAYISAFQWVFGPVIPGASVGSSGYTATLLSTNRDGSAVVVGATITNTATGSGDYGGSTYSSGASAIVTVTASTYFAAPKASKSVVSGSPAYPGGTVRYQLTTQNTSSATVGLTNPVCADLLPTSVVYVAGSWAVDSGATPTQFEQIDNYRGTGRTLLRWHYTTTLASGASAKLHFDTTVNATTAPGSFGNNGYVVGWDNDTVQISGSTTDTNDLNGNGSTTDSIAGSSAASVTVNSVVSLVSKKLVKGQLDATWSYYPTNGQSVPGGLANYQLTVNNNANVGLSNIIVIDILPYVGDTGVIDLSARNSAFTPYLAGSVSAGSGVTVYYSTATNPVRTEMGITVPNAQAANWSTVLPSDITTVHSVKFDFGTTVLGPGDQLALTWPMRIPTGAPTDGSIAWNSFGVIARRADNGSQLLATEPIKVGIAVQPIKPAAYGDFVWNDANHNGVQDSGEAGIDGVRVELYSHTGVQSGPDPTKDTYVGFTVTSGGGKYLFSSLPAGDYYAVFFTPPTYLISPALQGSDTTLDSNGTSTTVRGFPASITGITHLNIGDTDFTWDQGFYQPSTPVNSVGDYVWNDVNANGIQDEPAADGVNGVTVQLYQSASPAVVFASTTTANDLNGNPGYYRFDGLANGSYFLKFVAPSGDTFATETASGGTAATDSNADPVTGKTATFSLTGGVYDSTWDAGLILPTGSMSIGNQVWIEDDNDGVFEPAKGEIGVDGVTVNLYLDVNDDGVYTPGVDQFTGTQLTFTKSGAAGYYEFTSLPASPHKYIVQIDPANFTTGGALQGLAPAGPNPPANAATNTTDSLNKGYAVAGTPSSGVVTAGFKMTTGAEPGPAGNNDNGTIDFGFLASYSVGNRVFLDNGRSGGTAGDGVQNGGEPGVANVGVELLNHAGGVVASATTDANGFYRFDGVAAGTNYTVRIAATNFASGGPLQGFAASPSVVAGDKGNKGQAGGQPAVNGVSTASFNLGLGLEPLGEADGPHGTTGDAFDDLTQDFGFVATGVYSLGNLVFNDNGAGGGTANNGVRDGTEPGLPGVVVVLFGADANGAPTGAAVATQTTDGNGYYRFDALAAGAYVPVVDVTGSGTALQGMLSSTGVSTDTTLAGDLKDHGIDTALGAGSVLTNGIVGAAITLGPGLQPLGEATAAGAGANGPNGDAFDNLTDDFGFVARPPSAALLAYFKAASLGGREVALQWGTLVEVRALGFTVERGNADGSWTAVNSQTIPALGADGQPHRYAVEDAAAPPAVQVSYRLVELNARGDSSTIATATVATGPDASVTPEGGDLRLGVVGQPGGSAQLQSAPSPTGPWTTIQTWQLDDAGRGSTRLGSAPAETARFYRILTQ
jgi:fimbrial isopeptide formation D2 family protein/uncharacterized repeat protein (TIGR01451 family)